MRKTCRDFNGNKFDKRRIDLCFKGLLWLRNSAVCCNASGEFSINVFHCCKSFETWQSGFGLAVHNVWKKSELFFSALGVEGIAFHRTEGNHSPSNRTSCSARPELLTTTLNFPGCKRSNKRSKLEIISKKAFFVKVSKLMYFSLTSREIF